MRYLYELQMVLNDGFIKSEAGTWRYWRNETFSEEDLQLFLSDEDILVKSQLESMKEYCECSVHMKKHIECVSYKLDIFELIKKHNQSFTGIPESEKTV